MKFIERSFVKSDYTDASRVSRWVVKLVKNCGIELGQQEELLFKSYTLGYLMVHKSAYFADYNKSRHKHILAKIPLVSDAMNTADMTERIGQEILYELLDYESLLTRGDHGVINTNIRNLSNMLSGYIAQHTDTVGNPEQILPFDEIKEKCIAIINNWNMRQKEK